MRQRPTLTIAEVDRLTNGTLDNLERALDEAVSCGSQDFSVGNAELVGGCVALVEVFERLEKRMAECLPRVRNRRDQLVANLKRAPIKS